MLKATLTFALCGIVGITVTPAVRFPSTDDASPRMISGAKCMLRVLKSVRGIDGVEMGNTDAGGWSHPFVQYRAAPLASGYRGIVRFAGAHQFPSDNGKPGFEARLSSLSAIGEDPPDYGAGAMATLFERKCGVHVMVLFL